MADKKVFGGPGSEQEAQYDASSPAEKVNGLARAAYMYVYRERRDITVRMQSCRNAREHRGHSHGHGTNG